MNRLEVYKALIDLEYMGLEKAMHNMRMCTDAGEFQKHLDTLLGGISDLSEARKYVNSNFHYPYHPRVHDND